MSNLFRVSACLGHKQSAVYVQRARKPHSRRFLPRAAREKGGRGRGMRRREGKRERKREKERERERDIEINILHPTLL